MASSFSGGGVLYAAARSLLGAAVRLHFRRIELSRPDRLPTFGPVLLVANHPSSLTDVLVLGAAVDRRLHFLAHSGLFRPWYRGFLLRACGTLPVYRREDNPADTWRNDDTFKACHVLFDQGGVIVIFPEGTSETDRSVKKFKTGAARLALAYDRQPERAGRLAVVPVGLHFADRTAFGSDVIAAVGRPLALERYHLAAVPAEAGAAAAGAAAGDEPGPTAAAADAPSEDSAETAVRKLTADMQERIERLIVNVPDAELVDLVQDIERLYLDELQAARPDATALDLNQRIAACVAWYRTEDPPRLYRVWSRMRQYRRLLALHQLRDKAVREGIPPGSMLRTSTRLLLLGGLGVVPALAGAALNIGPARLSAWLGAVFAPDPTRIAFGRIMAGVVLFPLTYGLAGAWLITRHVVPPAAALGLLALSALLGLFALGYFRWATRERHRLHLARLAWTQRGTVVRVRRERRRLIARIEKARIDYLAANPEVAAGYERADPPATAGRAEGALS